MLIIHRVHQAKKGPRKGQDVVVECLIKKGHKLASGFTCCDPRDKFDLRFGMDKSFSRAMRQMIGRKDSDHSLPVVNQATIETIQSCGHEAPETKAQLFSQVEARKVCGLEQKFLDV